MDGNVKKLCCVNRLDLKICKRGKKVADFPPAHKIVPLSAQTKVCERKKNVSDATFEWSEKCSSEVKFSKEKKDPIL